MFRLANAIWAFERAGRAASERIDGRRTERNVCVLWAFWKRRYERNENDRPPSFGTTKFIVAVEPSSCARVRFGGVIKADLRLWPVGARETGGLTSKGYDFARRSLSPFSLYFPSPSSAFYYIDGPTPSWEGRMLGVKYKRPLRLIQGYTRWCRSVCVMQTFITHCAPKGNREGWEIWTFLPAWETGWLLECMVQSFKIMLGKSNRKSWTRSLIVRSDKWQRLTK